MPMVRVSVMETLERVIEVEADSIQDAVDEVQKMYDDQEIVLEARDFAGYETDCLCRVAGNRIKSTWRLSI